LRGPLLKVKEQPYLSKTRSRMREWRYSATDSEALHQIESNGQLHTPSTIASLKEPPLKLCIRLSRMVSFTLRRL